MLAPDTVNAIKIVFGKEKDISLPPFARGTLQVLMS